MKEKKKKRKFWMNRIVAFVTTVCMACVTFVVPAFAEETSGSSFTVYDGYSVSDGTYSHEFGADFSTDDVVVFVIEYDTTSEDTYGNVNRGVTYLFTSSSPFSGTWHFSRKANHADWSEYDDGTISVDSFNDNYGCYNYWPNGEYWPTTVNPSFIGKYIRMRVPSSISPMDYGQFVKKYYLGEDISDYVVESNLDGAGVYDDSIGYLQNVKVQNLVTTDDNIIRINYGSSTTTGFKLGNNDSFADSDIKIEAYFKQNYQGSFGADKDEEIISERYIREANLYKVDFSLREVFDYAYNNYGEYDFEENKYKRWAEWGMEIFTRAMSEKKCTSDIFLRPYVMDSGSKKFGGWTKIHINYDVNGDYDSCEISRGTTGGTMIEDFNNFEETLAPTEHDIEKGEGDLLDDAAANVGESSDSGWTFDIYHLSNIGEFFQNLMESLLHSIGTVPVMIKTCFSFLPSELILFLGAGLALIVILRIFGR